MSKRKDYACHDWRYMKQVSYFLLYIVALQLAFRLAQKLFQYAR